jgi:hypothetical protein
MEECIKHCENIPEPTLCPKGMRKENGKCITRRCSNGTRKNKQTDECEPPHKQTRNECMRTCETMKTAPKLISAKKLHKITIKVPNPTPKLGKCPTRKNKINECTLHVKTIDPITPRTTYIKDLSAPYLLGGVELFQVSFKSKTQFTHYVKITENTRVECFIQCLFSLGLRDLTAAKRDIETIKAYKNGVKYSVAEKYIQNAFGLKNGQIEHGTIKKPRITVTLNNHLTNNYATIFNIQLKGKTEWGHYVVAYKYNNIVYYFDPQANKHIVLDKINGSKILSFGCFKTNDIAENVIVKNTTAPIEFYGGNK